MGYLPDLYLINEDILKEMVIQNIKFYLPVQGPIFSHS